MGNGGSAVEKPGEEMTKPQVNKNFHKKERKSRKKRKKEEERFACGLRDHSRS